jgi:exopolysaccharide biosynthesis protein
MGCRDAMLFDGGPSTQLFVGRKGAPVSVEGDRHVPAYLVVKSR